MILLSQRWLKRLHVISKVLDGAISQFERALKELGVGVIHIKPDISLAMKTGHLEILLT